MEMTLFDLVKRGLAHSAVASTPSLHHSIGLFLQAKGFVSLLFEQGCFLSFLKASI